MSKFDLLNIKTLISYAENLTEAELERLAEHVRVQLQHATVLACTTFQRDAKAPDYDDAAPLRSMKLDVDISVEILP